MCLKYQGHCGGYASKKTQPLSGQPQQRIILPKPVKKNTWADLLKEPNYTSLVFSDQLEKDHFDYWLAFTRTTVLFTSDLLTQVIPQLSWNDPVIKHAALAIGATALGGSTRKQRLLGKGRYNSDALVHYGKALNLLYSSPMSSERTLVACLLFITFENLRGNKAGGLSHINHGVRILDQCHPQVADPDPLLEKVMSSFQHLSLQAWSHGGMHPKETHARVPWCCRGRKLRYAVHEMPSDFENLEMAHRWWNTVLHHVEHHAPLHSGFKVQGSAPLVTPKLPWEYGSPKSQEHIRSFARFIDAWHLSFLRLAVKAEDEKETNIANYLKALSLRIHYLYLWGAIRCAGWTDMEEIDRITPVFRDIVALSRELLAAQAARQPPTSSREIFTVEDSPTWPLGSTCIMCTDPEVSNEAVQLFRQYPRRDGLWDTHAFLVMVEWMNEKFSVGQVSDGKRHIFDCDVVFQDHTVVLRKKLWDPEMSEWRLNDVRFSIL